MDVSRELLLSFSSLGVFNGFILAIYFFFLARPKHRSHIFLGFLLLFLSLRIGKSVLFYFYDDLASTFIQLGLTACWLIGPFTYFYVKYATTKKEIQKPFWLYHLLILIPIALYINIKYPWEEFRATMWSTIIYVIYAQWFVYLAFSGILLRQVFVKKKIENIENSSFKVWILSIYFGNVMIWLSYNLSPYTSYITGAVTFSIIFYLLLLLILLTKKRKSLLLLTPPKYSEIKVDEVLADDTMKRLETIMREEKVFKDAAISLKEVAKKLGIPSGKLSQILNVHMKHSFPNLLGAYRIEEAKKMIKDKPNYSIESIGYECGFNSKSTFYSVFKKQTGLTPSQYKKQENS